MSLKLPKQAFSKWTILSINGRLLEYSEENFFARTSPCSHFELSCTQTFDHALSNAKSIRWEMSFFAEIFSHEYF